MRGVAHREAAQPKKAAEAFRRALKMNDKDADAYYQLALASASAGDLAAERTALEDAVGADANHADAWTNLGSVRGEAGDFSGEKAAYETALEAKPDHEAARDNLRGISLIAARDKARAGDYAGAGAVLTDALGRLGGEEGAGNAQLVAASAQIEALQDPEKARAMQEAAEEARRAAVAEIEEF